MSRQVDAIDKRIAQMEKERALLRRAIADKARDEQVLSNVRSRVSAERQSKYNPKMGGPR